MHTLSKIVLATVAAFALTAPTSVSAQAAINVDCTLVVPPNPLTAAGLSTPYQLAGLNQAKLGPCNMANPVQSTFVQGAIIDAVTGKIGIYNPLVIDAGTKAAAAPVVPKLNPFSVVGLWFGNNANSVTLIDNNGSLKAGNCVNGLTVNGKVDVFGEYAYCNAPAWFAVANQMIAAGMLVVPPLGTYNIPATATTAAVNKVPCASVRDFRVIDQDQSDNMVTSYLLTPQGLTAQDNAANAKALPTAKKIVNASDNRLISVAIAGATGCPAFTAPDLANPGGPNVPAVPLNELQAAAFQKAPIALVPANDPMVKLGMATQNLDKVNIYRAGVNQHPAASLAAINGMQYCTLYMQASPTYIVQNKVLLNKAGSSPAPDVATTLFTFMAQRMNGAVNADTLNCQAMLNVANAPFILTTNNAGVVTDAALDPKFTAQLNAAVAKQNAATAAAAAKIAADAAASKAAAQAQLTAQELAQLAQLQADQAKLLAIIAKNQAATAAAALATAQATAAKNAAVAAQAAAAAAAAKAAALANPNGNSAAALAAAKAAAAAAAQKQAAAAAAAKQQQAAAAAKTAQAAAAAKTAAAAKAAAAAKPAVAAKVNSLELALDGPGVSGDLVYADPADAMAAADNAAEDSAESAAEAQLADTADITNDDNADDSGNTVADPDTAITLFDQTDSGLMASAQVDSIALDGITDPTADVDPAVLAAAQQAADDTLNQLMGDDTTMTDSNSLEPTLFFANSVELNLDDTDLNDDGTDPNADIAFDGAGFIWGLASTEGVMTPAAPSCATTDAPSSWFNLKAFGVGVGSTMGFAGLAAAVAGMVIRSKQHEQAQLGRVMKVATTEI